MKKLTVLFTIMAMGFVMVGCLPPVRLDPEVTEPSSKIDVGKIINQTLLAGLAGAGVGAVLGGSKGAAIGGLLAGATTLNVVSEISHLTQIKREQQNLFNFIDEHQILRDLTVRIENGYSSDLGLAAAEILDKFGFTVMSAGPVDLEIRIEPKRLGTAHKYYSGYGHRNYQILTASITLTVSSNNQLRFYSGTAISAYRQSSWSGYSGSWSYQDIQYLANQKAVALAIAELIDRMAIPTTSS